MMSGISDQFPHFLLVFLGVKIEDRWDDVYEICRENIEDHCFVFNDTHTMMSCLGAKKPDVARKMVDSLKNWAR